VRSIGAFRAGGRPQQSLCAPTMQLGPVAAAGELADLAPPMNELLRRLGPHASAAADPSK
jgi:hypothetical protein